MQWLVSIPKKQVLQLAVSAALVALLTVQPARGQFFDYGFKGGAQVASFANAENTDYLTDYHFGMFMTIRPFALPVTIRPEVLYTRMGTDYAAIPADPGFPTPPGSLHISYIQVPLLINAYIPVPGPLHPGIYAGPYIAVMTSTRFEAEGQQVRNIDQWVQDSDYGIMFGALIEWDVAVTRLHTELRFVYGLESVFREDMNRDEQNRAISLSLGFAI